MKLPASTIIATDKFTRYLLVPQARGDKSAFLAGAGYTLENVDQLLDDLRTQILPLEAVPLESGKFGQYYENCRHAKRSERRDANGAHYLDNRALVGHHEVRYTNPGQTENAMKLELYTDAVLTCDVPGHRLKRGDIVKLVDHHIAPDGTEGYTIEVFNAVGDTIAVTAVPGTGVEPLREDEILCTRSVIG